MVFSTNQVRQLYVVKSVKGTDNATLDGVVTPESSEGDIALKSTKDGKTLYFQYKGADNLMRSDLINVDNIIHVNTINATHSTQRHLLKSVIVKLDENVNGGIPIGGQDYILRICINPYVGMSDEEPYFKYGAVHAVRGMSPAEFYAKMAASLYKNFSRELTKMLEFYIGEEKVVRVKTDSTGKESLIGTNGNVIQVADTYDGGIIIREVVQDWTRGIKEQVYVNFDVIPTTVTYDGDEVKWGTVTPENISIEIGNGKKIADLEYFCMGERGDQYRNVGWPNSIPTKYLVDPDSTYHILDIHYAYTGPNEGPQKSEKDITIVCTSMTELNKLIGQLKTASNIDIKNV